MERGYVYIDVQMIFKLILTETIVVESYQNSIFFLLMISYSLYVHNIYNHDNNTPVSAVR